MFPILQIGPFSLQTPGLILLLGIWLGLSVAERFSPKFGISADQIYNLVLVGLIAGLAGARLAYVARYPGVFVSSPLSIFSLNPGLLDGFSGAGMGLIAAWVYGQRKNMPFLGTLDALTPGLGVFAVAVGLSHLASGDAFGAPTGLPWGMELWGARRHPTQILETLIAALIFLSMVIGISQRKARRLRLFERPGATFLVFLALSAGARLFLEAFRGDSTVLFGGVRMAQAVSWILLALSLWALNRLQSPAREPQMIEK